MEDADVTYMVSTGVSSQVEHGRWRIGVTKDLTTGISYFVVEPDPYAALQMVHSLVPFRTDSDRVMEVWRRLGATMEELNISKIARTSNGELGVQQTPMLGVVMRFVMDPEQGSKTFSAQWEILDCDYDDSEQALAALEMMAGMIDPARTAQWVPSCSDRILPLVEELFDVVRMVAL